MGNIAHDPAELVDGPDVFDGSGNLPVTLFGLPGQAYLGYDGSYRSRFSSNPTPSAYTWIDGYTLKFHVGKDGGQEVPYIHLHFLSPKRLPGE